MALDTAEKRASAIAWGCPAGRTWPLPSGNLQNEASRQHMAYLYRLAPLAAYLLLYVDAMATYQPGMMAVGTYQAGTQEVDTYQPGTQAGQ